MNFHRLNMAPFGVKVLCIEPGFFKTNVTNSDILSKNVKMLWDRLPQDVRDDYGPDYFQKGTFKSFCLFFYVFVAFLFYLVLLFSLTALTVLKEKVEKISDGDLMKVVGCMEHAVAAVRPRTRYSPGWDAKLFWLPLSYMPSCVSDYILLKEAIPVAKQMQ